MASWRRWCTVFVVLSVALYFCGWQTLNYLCYLVASVLRENTFEVLARLTGLTFPGLTESFCQASRLAQVDDAEAVGLGRVHIAYSSDAHTFPGLLLSMLSVSKSMAEPSTCTFHVIVSEADMQQARHLAACFQEELAAVSSALPNVVLHQARNRTSTAALAWTSSFMRDYPRLTKHQNWERLYLHEYLPKVRRVIWLDTDVIVRSDISMLYRMKMQHAVAARWTIPLPYVRCFWENPGLPRGDRLWSLEAGVLVMDLEEWQALHLAEEAQEWSVRFAGCGGNQMALSYALQGAFDFLPWSWHASGLGFGLVRYTFLPCLKHADVLHWSGTGGKPWMDSRDRVLDPFVEPYMPRKTCGAFHQPSWLQRGIPLEGRSKSSGACASHGAKSGNWTTSSKEGNFQGVFWKR